MNKTDINQNKRQQAQSCSIQLIEAHHQPLQDYWNGRTYCSSTWRFYHNENPGGAICIDKTWTELDPDRCYLIAPGTTFLTRGRADIVQFYMHFTCGAPFDGAQHPLYSLPVDDRMRDDMRKIIAEIHAANSPFTPQGITRSLSLALYALSLVDEKQVMRRFADPRIEKTVSHIRAYPHDLLSIADMAARCHLSEGGFLRLFKQNTGVTPHAFIIQCRIRKAEYLLSSTDIPIDEITRLCGFEDRFHFSRTFKKHTAQSPAYYRKAHLMSAQQ